MNEGAWAWVVVKFWIVLTILVFIGIEVGKYLGITI
jgi:hypothetical protein